MALLNEDANSYCTHFIAPPNTNQLKVRFLPHNVPFLLTTVPRPVTIQYRRLPDRLGHFRGLLHEESRDRLVIEHHVRIKNPRKQLGKVVIANGFLVVWFIFRGKWYDVGKFYDSKGRFVGYYCDIISPVGKLLASPSKTAVITDLFLDLWIDRKGRCVVLDEDEFMRAVAKRAISVHLARRACGELYTLMKLAKSGRFPTRAIRMFQPRSLIPRRQMV